MTLIHLRFASRAAIDIKSYWLKTNCNFAQRMDRPCFWWHRFEFLALTNAHQQILTYCLVVRISPGLCCMDVLHPLIQYVSHLLSQGQRKTLFSVLGKRCWKHGHKLFFYFCVLWCPRNWTTKTHMLLVIEIGICVVMVTTQIKFDQILQKKFLFWVDKKIHLEKIEKNTKKSTLRNREKTKTETSAN